jgi:hypothetical protein
MSPRQTTFGPSPYGGEGWSPRTDDTSAEIGNLWRACGLDSEWTTLRVGEEREVARRLADLGERGAFFSKPVTQRCRNSTSGTG